eukprot:9059571-Alexandrium_andersonii.AAC.1
MESSRSAQQSSEEFWRALERSESPEKLRGAPAKSEVLFGTQQGRGELWEFPRAWENTGETSG